MRDVADEQLFIGQLKNRGGYSYGSTVSITYAKIMRTEPVRQCIHKKQHPIVLLLVMITKYPLLGYP